LGTDPLGGGVVASLARPGGNVTGLTSLSTDIASKRLELLREVVPGLRRLAIMVNVGFPDAVLDASEAQAGLNRSASKSPRSKSGERGISCPAGV
jgi:putative ABC transport system substrate-binding protein